MRYLTLLLLFLILLPTAIQAADAPVPASGAGDLPGYAEVAGEDGLTRRGVVWPVPRFVDNSNGTVTDQLTGLVWLKNANAFGVRTLAQARADCAALANGQYSLTDGSTAGQWRLPSIRELKSLVCVQYVSPALADTQGTAKWTANQPFSSVQSDFYWASSSYIGTSRAWLVSFWDGYVHAGDKSSPHYVWPVRAGP